METRQQSRLPGEGPGYQSLNGGILAPPLPSTGHIPCVRLKTEIPDRTMEPPPCVQNAMMKQTKKPFTYTPGGIDLSEIKSPRMQRRIERNANYDGIPEPPRPNPHQVPAGPLPPSALAAMQPQMHVQVFPSGPPPPPPAPRGGIPPPPPPMSGIPPPPPPPTQPLPTQKVTTSDHQVVERPDMTKIIPDNPMALLRKTGGVPERKSLLDEVYQQNSVPLVQRQIQQNQRPAPSQQGPRSPPIQQRSPPVQQAPRSPPQQGPRSPQIQQSPRSPPIQQQKSPPVQQIGQNRWGQVQSPSTVQNQQQWNQTPQNHQQQVQNNHQWNPAQQNQQRVSPQQQNAPQPPWVQPEPPKYQPKIIERPEHPPVKTSTAHLGSLYIPPLNQQPQQYQEQPRKVTSPPPPPQRNLQSPQSPPTPNLKEAPKPWQKQAKQQEELPPWAKREPVGPSAQETQGPTNDHPNAVYITQPLVLQHPGPVPRQPPQNQRQQPRVDAQGAIVIPVQVEGAKKPQTPVTPGNERSYNRQQSWGNTPAQSNAFKVIQRITQTDGDEEDENEPVIEHAPKYPQQFPQQTNDQIRKLKLTEGDRDLMNRFKQGVDDENSLHNEVDPRYRGAAIPSKAFKLLQSMTDGPSESPSGAPVARGSPGRQPQVRTIPIQIERDDQPRNYVHPSEQTVPEPKKYMGSAIPSRSFKILQAMTAPDSCANANEVNETPSDPSSPGQWGYDPKYAPPPPHPLYWPDCYNFYYRPTPPPQNESNEKESRKTPIPFWGYYPPPPYLPPNERESTPVSGRQTPLPFWGYYPYYYDQEPNNVENAPQYQHPPYWDPYCFYYPPVYSPYPFYGYNENEDGFGYSSTDEVAYINRGKSKERDLLQTQKSTTPRIVITPTLPEKHEETLQVIEVIDESESETEVEETIPIQRPGSGLKSIKSVQNISVYDEDEALEENYSDCEPNIEECSENTEDNDDSTASSYIVGEDTIPHELSIIFEESEQTDRSKRECSVVSDSTTIADRSCGEEEEISTTVSIKLPRRSKSREDVEICASFTVPCAIPPEIEVESAKVDEPSKAPEEEEETEEEQDWWGILNKDEDQVFASRPKSVLAETSEDFAEELTEVQTEVNEEDDDASSTSSSDSSLSESNQSSIIEETKEPSSAPNQNVTESLNKEENDVNNNSEETEEKSLSIKERIEALRNCIQAKKSQLTDKIETKSSVKEKISVIEVTNGQLKPVSTKSSLKSEEFSEEEGDSGVTSDMSRHDTDEQFPELKKMSRYQRAQTHSRLYKLLQEVGDDEDEEDEKEKPATRPDQLSLPLKSEETTQVDESLVSELVQSMLKRKQGQVFRDISKDKLQAAARRTLQEETDTLSTPDSCFLSPMRNSTESSTPAQTPQEFYDYKQYYDSWTDSDRFYGEEYDILPSKAFKLLQEHAGLNKTGAIAGLLAKCPKVLSYKNVHQELARLLECSESPSPSPEQSFEPKEVSGAS